MRRSNTSSNTNRTEGSGANTREVIYIRLPAKSKKKKGVTWADESDSTRSQSLPASHISSSPGPSSNQQDDETLSNEVDNDDTTMSAESGIRLQEDSMNIDDCSTPEQHVTTSSKQESVTLGNQFPLHRKLRKLPERPILRKAPLPVIDVSKREDSVESETEDKPPDLSKELSGWDSDLTDISTASGDLGETDSGSSESDNNDDNQEDKVSCFLPLGLFHSFNCFLDPVYFIRPENSYTGPSSWLGIVKAMCLCEV